MGIISSIKYEHRAPRSRNSTQLIMSTAIAESRVKLNIDELKGFVKHIVNNNRIIQAEGKNPVAVNVEGEAGLGKTSAIEQVAEELGLSFVKLGLSQIEELGDLVGFPVRQFQLCKIGGGAKLPLVDKTKVEIAGAKMVTKIVDGTMMRVP